MSTVTVPRTDVTSEEVSEALRNGLGPAYNVLPGMHMSLNPFGAPKTEQADAILVGTGSNRVWRAQVSIIHQLKQTEIRIRPGGLSLTPRLINDLGIVRKVTRTLQDAPGLGSPPA